MQNRFRFFGGAALCLPLSPLLAAPAKPPVKPVMKPAAKPAVNPVSAVKTIVSAPLVAPSLAGWNYGFADAEADDFAETWSWTAKVSPAGNAPWEARVVFNYENAQNHWLLHLSSDGKNLTASYWKITEGKATLWGEAPVTLSGAGSGGQLTLQRSAWQARALWNGRAILSAFGVAIGEKLGTSARGAAWSDERFQPTEPVVKQDDFMRAEEVPDEAIKSVATGVAAPTGTPNEWRVVSGSWKTSMMIDSRVRFDSSLNPNPFVYRAEAKGKTGTALTNIGKWFWSDYSVAVALKPVLKDPAAPLTAGVAAYGQSNGQAIVGEVDFRSGRATLRQGNEVLAQSEPFACAPNQWHRLFLEPGPGTVRLLVNGVERLRATPKEFKNWQARPLAQGEAALRAQLGGGNFVDFDDVRVAPNNAISDDFSQRAIGRWDDFGLWQTQPGRRVKAANGAAMALTGTARDEGRLEANFTRLKSGPAPRAGLVFGWRDPKNYFVVRSSFGFLDILEIADGKEKVLAKDNAYMTGARAGILSREVSVEWQNGNITAHSGDSALTATVNAVPEGRVGLWGDGAAGDLAVTGFRALSAAPGWGEPPLPDRFQKDRLMRFWASNAGAWRSLNFEPDAANRFYIELGTPAAQRVEKMWMHTGDFFKDAEATIPLPDMTAGAKLILHLRENLDGINGTPAISTSSWRLKMPRNIRRESGGAAPVAPPPAANVQAFETGGARLEVEREGANWVFRLFEGKALVKSATLPYAAPKPPAQGELYNPAGMLRFVRRPAGGDQVMLRATLDGKTLFSETVPASAAGTKILLRLLNVPSLAEAQGAVPANHFWFERATADSAARLDYTFTGAPVDWLASRGRWEVAERWTCQPQFGFFRGDNALDPTLWSRFSTKGDYTLEAYLATPMDYTRGEKSPVDLNVTVDADGRDLGSGYSFVFAPKGNWAHYVLRGGALAQKTAAVTPQIYGGVHQDWYYIRIERRRTPEGVRFRWIVNNQLIANYLDNQPLDKSGGRIAFWTHNYGLSIARVRLWHDGLEAAPENGLAPLHDNSIKNALDEWAPRRDGVLETSAQLERVNDEGGKGALKIVNPQSGGDWTVFVSRKPFDATKTPLLKFDYRVPQDVFVNLYAKVNGRWREIVFTGSNTRGGLGEVEVPETNNLRIGKMAGVQADNQWHSVTFDLKKALETTGLDPAVEALAFAAPERGYLRAGIGGNKLGAAYWLRDFQAVTAAEAPKTIAAR